MKSILKKSILLVAFFAASVSVFGQTLYVVSGKCNVPLAAGMNSAKYQLFTWDGSEAKVTEAITCDPTNTGGSYYNSTSLAISNLSDVSNYSSGSSSSRTMQGIKLGGGNQLTISLGSITMSRVVVVGRSNSNDALSIDILGETIETNSKDYFVVDKSEEFSGEIVIDNTTAKEYIFHVYMIEGEGEPDPGEDPQDDGEPVVTSISFDNMVAGSDVYDEDNLAIKAKIKFGSDRTNIKPAFKGKNISDNWTPVSADFEANETNTFTFQYTKSGKVKNYEVTITEAPKEEPGEAKYISSLFFEQIVLDEGVKYDIEGALTAHNYNFENINSLDSLNDEKDLRNEPYLGLKIKKSGGYISGTLKGGSTVRVKFGYVAEVVNVSVNNSSQALEPIDNRLDNLEFTAPEDVHIKISTTSDKTVVLKQIAVDEDIRDVTLPESPSSDPVAVSNVLISKETLSLEVGQSETITATIVPSDATNKKVTWESSDESVATVSNGKVTAVAEGTATITVKTDDGGFTATCDVTVTKKETPIDPPADDEGEFTTRTITDNGAVSTWTFNQRSSAFSVKEAEPIIDNEMIFAPNGDGNIKFQTSSYLSCKGESTIGVPVPADGAGTIAITTSSSSDGRWFQLYINQEEGTEQQRLWSKQADEITDNKKGPQSFEFTSADLTTYQGKTYLHFKDNNAEMKIASFVVTLTSGAYDGSSTPADPVAVNGVSLDKETLELEEGKSQTLTATVAPSDATNKKVTWESSDDAVATVSNGKVTAVAEGTATITVKTDDGSFTATCDVTVTKKSDEPDPELPDVGLTAHGPDIYDDPFGYNTQLSPFGGYEYEVYYIGRDLSDNPSVATTPSGDKVKGLTTSSSNSTCKADDNWFEIKSSGGKGGDTAGKAKDEFKEDSKYSVKFRGGNEMLFQVKGFDQFSFYGKDNNKDASKGKQFEVYIDDKKVSGDPIDGYAIHRYDMSTKEHVIKLVGIGDGDSKLTGFSLRVAQEPRVKYFDGNDTTQKVLQTSDIKPVVYFAKYAQKGQVKLEWSGATAEGITLETLAQTDLGDSIALSGQANCPVGTYNYAVVTYFGGKETSRAKGKFSVISDIKATSDLIVNAYTGEEMEQITFKYYALSADDVKVTWPNGQPDGISGKGNNGIYTIGGTPTAAGEYPFSVTVTGSETVIEGKIKIQTIDIGSNAVLYLYKTNGAEEKDGLFAYLKKNWNPIARKTIDDLRDPEQYAKYQWIFISEDADSDNPEVLALIKGGSSLPIFSVNGFTYTKDRLDWGEPDNGALTEEALSLTVQRDDHPIFKKLGKKQGSKVQVLSNENLGKKGLMPIRVKLPGTHCLATAWTRDINDYNGNGEQQTVLHEIPAKMRGGEKYICLPIAASSTDNLSAEGKQLIDAIISYLLDGSVSPVFLPTLQINRFTLGGVDGVIDQANYTIEVEMTDEQFNDLDSLRAAKPVITLADPTYSHVEPAADKEQDFRFSSFIPVVYTVTDYINRLPYAVSLRIKNTQGIDEVYTVGEWVNIFDVYGRKVATTNEDIHAMPLPNGMYIVVTESGQTLKIMR